MAEVRDVTPGIPATIAYSSTLPEPSYMLKKIEITLKIENFDSLSQLYEQVTIKNAYVKLGKPSFKSYPHQFCKESEHPSP